MIDSLLLSYLVVFAQVGSLSKAGEILHLSQPSLSKAMQKLEAELDLTIFDRKGNRLSLNDDGKAILDEAKDIVMMLERLKKKAQDLKMKSRELYIGMVAPGPMYRYPSLFVSDEKMKVTAVIKKEDELIQGLLHNIYDLIFIDHYIALEGIIAEKVLSEKLYISIPKTHFLARFKDAVSFKDIDGQTFLLSTNIGIWQKVLDKHMARSRFIKQSDREELKEIVQYSTIPSFVSDLSMEKNAVNDRINIPIIDDDAKLDLYALYKKGRHIDLPWKVIE